MPRFTFQEFHSFNDFFFSSFIIIFLFFLHVYGWKELSRYITPLQELYELQPRVRTVCLCTCDLVIESCDVKHRGSLVMMLWGCVWELWEWQVKSHTSDISHRSREVNSWALSFHKLCLNTHCLHWQITAAQFTKSCEQNRELSEAPPPGELASYLMNIVLNIVHVHSWFCHHTFKGFLIIFNYIKNT